MFARVTRDVPIGDDPYRGIKRPWHDVSVWRCWDRRKISPTMYRYTIYVCGMAAAIQKLAAWTGGVWEEVI